MKRFSNLEIICWPETKNLYKQQNNLRKINKFDIENNFLENFKKFKFYKEYKKTKFYESFNHKIKINKPLFNSIKLSIYKIKIIFFTLIQNSQKIYENYKKTKFKKTIDIQIKSKKNYLWQGWVFKNFIKFIIHKAKPIYFYCIRHNKLDNWILKSILPKNDLNSLKILSEDIILFSKFLKEKKPKHIIFPEVNVFYNHFLYIDKILKDTKARILVSPFSLTGPHELQGALLSKVPERTKEFYENQKIIFSSQNERLFFDLSTLLIHLAFKINNFQNLQIVNESNSKRIVNIFSSEFEKKYFHNICNKSISSKWQIIRPSYLKKLFIKRKETPHKKTVLVALPPNQYGSDKKSVVKYFNAIKKIYIPLKRLNLETYTVLHPRFNKEWELELKKILHGKVINEPIYEALLEKWLFIFSVSSSNLFAILGGIPSINFDFYKFKYNDFNHIKGTVTVFDEKFYFRKVKELLAQKNYKILKANQVFEAQINF